ncbi:iron ABC transporter permease [Dactylosporangium sp. NPDC051484]|uniref:ABC transporter permease n=1 Tax=Dactylosporangium sp. NPDC051484 TaxID=3154942 RepID=UPI00344D7422
MSTVKVRTESDNSSNPGSAHASMRARVLAAVRIGSHQWPYLTFVVMAIAIGIGVLLPMGGVFYNAVFPQAGSFSLEALVTLFTRPRTVEAFKNTAILVAGATVFALVQGVLLAWLVTRTNLPFKRMMSVFPIMPLFLPPVVGTVAWVFLLGENSGLINIALRAVLPGNLESGPIDIFGLGGMIWVVGLYITPYVYLILQTSFRQYDSSFDEAARLSGSSAITIMWRITLPILLPAILSGALLAFVTVMSQFSIPVILGGPPQISVLTTEIYLELRRYPRDVTAAAALSAVTIIATAIALYFQRRVLRREKRFVTIGGKGARQQRVDLGRWRWHAFALMVVYALVTTVAPVLAITNVSLRRYWSSDLSLDGLTLDNFDNIINGYSATWPSITNSLVLATIGSTIGLIMAVFTAYTVRRTTIRGRGTLDYLATLPLAVPATVLGAGLLMVFLYPPFALYGTPLLLIIAYVGHHLPYGLRSADSAFHQVSSELEESSLVSGSGWLATMRHVTIPLIAPAIAAGWIFLFVLMSREFSASALLASPQTPVMALVVKDLWDAGVMPQLAAFSFIVMAICVATSIVSEILGRRAAGGR